MVSAAMLAGCNINLSGAKINANANVNANVNQNGGTSGGSTGSGGQVGPSYMVYSTGLKYDFGCNTCQNLAGQQPPTPTGHIYAIVGATVSIQVIPGNAGDPTFMQQLGSPGFQPPQPVQVQFTVSGPNAGTASGVLALTSSPSPGPTTNTTVTSASPSPSPSSSPTTNTTVTSSSPSPTPVPTTSPTPASSADVYQSGNDVVFLQPGIYTISGNVPNPDGGSTPFSVNIYAGTFDAKPVGGDALNASGSVNFLGIPPMGGSLQQMSGLIPQVAMPFFGQSGILSANIFAVPQATIDTPEGSATLTASDFTWSATGSAQIDAQGNVTCSTQPAGTAQILGTLNMDPQASVSGVIGAGLVKFDFPTPDATVSASGPLASTALPLEIVGPGGASFNSASSMGANCYNCQPASGIFGPAILGRAPPATRGR